MADRDDQYPRFVSVTAILRAAIAEATHWKRVVALRFELGQTLLTGLLHNRLLFWSGLRLCRLFSSNLCRSFLRLWSYFLTSTSRLLVSRFSSNCFHLSWRLFLGLFFFRGLLGGTLLFLTLRSCLLPGFFCLLFGGFLLTVIGFNLLLIPSFVFIRLFIIRSLFLIIQLRPVNRHNLEWKKLLVRNQ